MGNEMNQIYERKDVAYKALIETAQDTMRELIRRMNHQICDNPVIEEQMRQLVQALETTTGKKQYPAITDQETLSRVLEKRSAKQAPAQKTEAQKLLRRLSGHTATEQMEQQVLNLLNGLIISPERITLPEPEHLPKTPVQALQRELDTVMDQQPIDEDAAQKLILAIAAAQYSAINPNQYETIRLRKLLSKQELMTELDAELLQSSVSAILCYRDGTMDIQLKNHQMIGRSETV